MPGSKKRAAEAMHFPLDRDAQYFEQLTAERLRTRYVKGFPQRFWRKPDGRRNEALDCRVDALPPVNRHPASPGDFVNLSLEPPMTLEQLKAQREALRTARYLIVDSRPDGHGFLKLMPHKEGGHETSSQPDP